MTLPIDGYVLDHSIKAPSRVYPCSYCSDTTYNYSKCTLSGAIDSEHCCDSCFDNWKGSQPYD